MDNNAKLRPLYLAKILYERTDEDHYLTTMQLAQILERNTVSRRTGRPSRRTLSFCSSSEWTSKK